MKKFICLLLAVGMLLCFFPTTAFAARPRVVISGYSTSLSTVYPGDTFSLSLIVKNAGDAEAKNVLVTLKGTEASVSVLGGNVWFDSSIASGGSKTATFSLAAATNAVSKTYNFEASIEYEDTTGTTYTATQTIGVFVTEATPQAPQTAVIISSYTISPSVITPGGQFTLEMELKNVSDANVKNVSISVASAMGAIATVGTGDTKFISSLAAGGKQKISFNMVSEGSATAKTLILEITLKFEDSKGTTFTSAQKIGLVHSGTTEPSSLNPQIVIARYTVLPAQIVPGENFNLQLVLKNNSRYRAKDVLISLGNVTPANTLAGGASSATEQGAFTSSDAVVVLGTGNTRYISSLSKGGENELSFELISNAALSSGVYNFPVKLNYVDSKGNACSSSQVVGLIVLKKPDLAISSLNYPREVIKGEKFNVIAEFENRSDFVVKGVLIELKSDDFQITDGKFFVGTLEAEDSDTLEASAVAKKTGEKEATLILKYRDDFNQEQKIEKKIKIKVNPALAKETEEKDSAKRKSFFAKIISFFKALFGLGG